MKKHIFEETKLKLLIIYCYSFIHYFNKTPSHNITNQTCILYIYDKHLKRYIEAFKLLCFNIENKMNSKINKAITLNQSKVSKFLVID